MSESSESSVNFDLPIASIEDTKLIERHRLQSECLQLQQELGCAMVELQCAEELNFLYDFLGDWIGACIPELLNSTGLYC